ncbi:MAG: hypothetical protein HKN58_00715 [Xanthomonadales bacterium]|nr:hypothetical protein [Xanthomonadales bacterium]
MTELTGKSIVRPALVALVLCISPLSAQAVLMTIAQDASVVNHYPGPDGLIGNGDDVVSDAVTTVQSSAPNSSGSYGHNAFNFGGAQDASIPTGYNAITFVDGTVDVDTAVMTAGGGPIVNALNISSGTEPFPGHGAYTSTITTVNSGSYDAGTQQFTLNVDFSYNINGSVSNEPGVTLTGTAIYQEAADFGTPTGNTYFDNVVVPLAQAAGAASAVFITGTGNLTNLGYPISATIVALEGGTVTINAGMNDAWVSADAPFQGFFFTVYEDLALLFLSWFTFDSVPPTSGTATFGAIDHRWVTGAGTINGNTVTINVELTTGGAFNTDDPVATQQPAYGTITIVFINCNQAVLTYDFPGPGLSGQMTLTRVVTDNVALCEALSGA